MFEIQFLGPVAVYYRNPQDEARLVICDPEAHGLEARLSDFHWGNYLTPEKPIKFGLPTWECWDDAPEIGIRPPFVDGGHIVLWTLSQEKVEFLFTTTATHNDLWRVLTFPQNPAVVTLTQLYGLRDYCNSTPGRFLADPNALTVFEANADGRWRVGPSGDEQLPFRILTKVLSPEVVPSP